MLVFEPQMVKVCEIGLLGGQIFMKMLEKSYAIVTVYAHPFIRYCWTREPHLVHMNYHTLFLKTCQNIKFNEYGNHFSQKKNSKNTINKRQVKSEWYIFNKNQFLFQIF